MDRAVLVPSFFYQFQARSIIFEIPKYPDKQQQKIQLQCSFSYFYFKFSPRPIKVGANSLIIHFF